MAKRKRESGILHCLPLAGGTAHRKTQKRHRPYGNRLLGGFHMANISIAGAGIAGPAAALALLNAGHDVTIYESRQPEDVASSGAIGITEVNCTVLRPLGVDLNEIALDNLYHEWADGGMTIHRFTSEKFVVWSQVH